MPPELLEPDTHVEATRAVIAVAERTDESEEKVRLLLFEAGCSGKRDFQEWALYGLDRLMSSNSRLAIQVLNDLIDTSHNRAALETVSRYLAGSQYTRSAEFNELYDRFSARYLIEFTEQIVPEGYVVRSDGDVHTANTEELIVIVHGTWTHGVPILREIEGAVGTVRQVVRDVGQLLNLLWNPWQDDPEHVQWPVRDNWYEYPEKFPAYLDEQSKGAVYKPLPGSPWPFFWSGRNDQAERAMAAARLKKWVDTVHPKEDLRTLTVVAHSHGGNVALLAAARHGLKMQKLILLGTPIRTDYPVNMENISKIWNVYSHGDIVQQIGALPNLRGEARTLSDTREISNVFVETKPSHPALHDDQVWKDNELGSIVLKKIVSRDIHE